MAVAAHKGLFDEALDECARVSAWRWDQFRRMGFSKAACAKLDASRADIHEVASAVDRGCSKNLILDIFV